MPYKLKKNIEIFIFMYYRRINTEEVDVFYRQNMSFHILVYDFFVGVENVSCARWTKIDKRAYTYLHINFIKLNSCNSCHTGKEDRQATKTLKEIRNRKSKIPGQTIFTMVNAIDWGDDFVGYIFFVSILFV